MTINFDELLTRFVKTLNNVNSLSSQILTQFISTINRAHKYAFNNRHVQSTMDISAVWRAESRINHGDS